MLVIILLLISYDALSADPFHFRKEDLTFLAGLTLDRAKPVAIEDNDVDLSGIKLVSLGQRLFFDSRLSANGQVSCSGCHKPEKYFTDGLPQGVGLGLTTRNTPSVLVAKYSPWQTWDGHKDSIWSQALGPLESATEHGMTRGEVVQVIKDHYLADYLQIFGSIKESQAGVNQAFANVGKALMAYQYQLAMAPSRFDKFVAALQSGSRSEAKKLFSTDEVKGLRLFAGKGNCISCHNGPLFTNFEFHNVGVPPRDQKKLDLGRYSGVKSLARDEFTCLSPYSGREKESCLEMKYLKTSGPELVGAFKTPSLRNVAMTAPYMHAGQFQNLEQVLDHYNKPKPPFYDRKQHPNRPHFDILPLGLSDVEKGQIIAFLKTLTSAITGSGISH